LCARKILAEEDLAMKPLAIQAGRRILLIAGDPKQLEGVELKKNPRANLVIVKKELET
jgi:hypothetical protein